jgi:hypothetical protein
MKQRGRRSQASLALVQGRPRLVATSLPDESPPPPDDLAAPERAIWCAITAEWRGTPSSFVMLATALKAHQRARECGEIIEAEGMCVTGRDGQTKAHPLLAVERSATASFQRQLKALKVKF